ncbi:MAG TPA: hypothetical protein VNN79_13205 [Actinomycetota bacterium]|nr:hypothetical protein [Actinomycetota bacterium]
MIGGAAVVVGGGAAVVILATSSNGGTTATATTPARATAPATSAPGRGPGGTPAGPTGTTGGATPHGTGSPHATPPGTTLPGRIVFSCAPKGLSICEMNPDGTHVRVLVRGGGRGEVCCGHPVLSPDGTELAYEGPEGTLVITSADGKHDFSPPDQFPGFGFSPAWSPRGDELAFISGDGSIRLVDSDGTGVRTVFRSPNVGTGGVAWSPDGTELAFTTRPRGNPIPSGDIDVVATTGGPTHTLVTGVLDGAAGLSWAPGPDLLFTSMHEATIREAGRTRGGRPVGGLHGHGSDVSPSWGPDGVHFSFVRAGRVVIATVADGVRTTIGPADVTYAQWSGPR